MIKRNKARRCSICGELGHNRNRHKYPEGMKKCHVCQQILQVEMFRTVRGENGDGTPFLRSQSICIDCDRKSSTIRYNDTMEHRLGYLIHASQQRAKVKDIAFDIDVPYLMQLYEKQKGLCAYSGLPLTLEPSDNLRVSIDRVEPAKGYIKGNVALACWVVNNMKCNLNAQEFLDMCQRVLDYHADK